MLKDMQFSGRWRDYQARVLAEMDQHIGDGRLHVVAAPGAGKTVLGLEIVRRFGRPAVVFARTPQGRRILLRARTQSFAAGFQRMVDRRSVWL
jgi:KaiC/GvpD/RAD55 family RecA-like ATPase